MNNQDRSFEGPLTEGRARQLIQELFPGKTVRKLEIVTAVRQEYQKCGGDSSADDEGMILKALEVMKGAGIAENLRHDLWFITHYIKTLHEFIDWVQLRKGECLFRGLPKSTYEISASAYRRTEIGYTGEKQEGDFNHFVQINADLVNDAILRGYDEKDGQNLEELEILAELQHFGAATGLIDFTRNAQIALWFACATDSRTSQDSENSLEDGKVVAVRNVDRFKMINSNLLQRKITDFFQNNDPEARQEQLYQWEPAQRNNRIIAQQSVFLFGDSKITPDRVCIIDGESKREILESLRRVAGITEAALFPDFDGFAHLRHHSIPSEQPGGYQDRIRANQALGQNDYRRAFIGYNKVIASNPYEFRLYYQRGLARHGFEDYDGAKEDFTKAINMPANPEHGDQLPDLKDSHPSPKPGNVYSYHWRGNVNYLLGRYEEAIADYDMANSFHVNPNAEYSYYWRGLANYELGEYNKAIADLNKTIALKPNYSPAYYWRGLANFGLGKCHETKQDLQKALELAEQERNTEYVEKVEQKLNEIK